MFSIGAVYFALKRCFCESNDFLIALFVKELTCNVRFKPKESLIFNILLFLSRRYPSNCIQPSRLLLHNAVYFSDLQFVDQIRPSPDKALGVWASTLWRGFTLDRWFPGDYLSRPQVNEVETYWPRRCTWQYRCLIPALWLHYYKFSQNCHIVVSYNCYIGLLKVQCNKNTLL